MIEAVQLMRPEGHVVEPQRPTSGSEECCFCGELDGRRSEFHRLYPSIETRVVLETPKFTVMPSIGMLARGHMLIMPRRHVTSFGELTPTERREAMALYLRLRATLERRYSPVVGFEHGSPVGARSGGCGIVHAHVHVVPMGHRAVVLPPSVGRGWQVSQTRSWLDHAAASIHGGAGYLMWHGPAQPPILEVAERISSQFLRRHVANLLGHDAWDWRAIGFQAELAATVRDHQATPVADGWHH